MFIRHELRVLIRVWVLLKWCRLKSGRSQTCLAEQFAGTNPDQGWLLTWFDLVWVTPLEPLRPDQDQNQVWNQIRAAEWVLTENPQLVLSTSWNATNTSCHCLSARYMIQAHFSVPKPKHGRLWRWSWNGNRCKNRTSPSLLCPLVSRMHKYKLFQTAEKTVLAPRKKREHHPIIHRADS